MSKTVRIRPNSTTNNSLLLFVAVDEKQIVYPDKCSSCLSTSDLALKDIGGIKITSSAEADSNRLVMTSLFGAFGNTAENKPLSLRYKGKIPYCKNCADKAKKNAAIKISAFDTKDLILDFENEEYADEFIKLNQEIIRTDQLAAKSEIKISSKACPKCSGMNSSSAYFCKSCGASLR